MTWFLHDGILLLWGFGLLAYEIIAITTGWVPTVTADVRGLLTTFTGSLLFGLGWAALTMHFFTGWPK